MGSARPPGASIGCRGPTKDLTLVGLPEHLSEDCATVLVFQYRRCLNLHELLPLRHHLEHRLWVRCLDHSAALTIHAEPATNLRGVRHAANTSKVDATANASESSDSEAGRAGLLAAARARVRVGPPAISSQH